MKSEYLKPEAVFMKVESTTMLAASPATYMRSERKPAEVQRGKWGDVWSS